MQQNLRALSEREKEALRLMARGHDAKSAARTLDVSSNAINERLRDARRKLGVSSSREAARFLLLAEGQAAQETCDEKIGLDTKPRDTATVGGPDRRRRIARPSLLVLSGVSIMLLIAVSALLWLHGGSTSEENLQPPQPAKVASAAASPSGPSRRAYLLSLDIRLSGRSVALPSISLRAGEIGSVSSTGAYAVQIVATPDPERTGHVLVSASISVEQERSVFRYLKTRSVAEGDSAAFEPDWAPGGVPVSVVIAARPIA